MITYEPFYDTLKRRGISVIAENGLNIDKVFVLNDHMAFNKQDDSLKPHFLIDSNARKMIFLDYGIDGRIQFRAPFQKLVAFSFPK